MESSIDFLEGTQVVYLFHDTFASDSDNTSHTDLIRRALVTADDRTDGPDGAEWGAGGHSRASGEGGAGGVLRT